MESDTVIAIDAMGGDHGVDVTVVAGCNILEKHPHISIIFVGIAADIERVLKQRNIRPSKRLVVHNATEIVEMDESPAIAMRTKKDSSMRVALNLVNEGKAEACVSAGNTGALMATARYVLKMIPGVDRPAILARIPIKNKKFISFLDLGASVDCDENALVQFAAMGSVVANLARGIENPRVALLNIGEEAIKGKDTIKSADEMLRSIDEINYIGFLEPSNVFEGGADVVVCDGFTGNIALKTLEGAFGFISYLIKGAFHRNFITKIIGLLAMKIIRGVKKDIDPDENNGALMAGLKGIVIKSHGSSEVSGFMSAIEEAALEVKRQIPEKIGEKIAKILGQ